MQKELSRHESSLNIVNDYVIKLNGVGVTIDDVSNIASLRRRWQLLVDQLSKWTDTLQVCFKLKYIAYIHLL